MANIIAREIVSIPLFPKRTVLKGHTLVPSFHGSDLSNIFIYRGASYTNICLPDKNNTSAKVDAHYSCTIRSPAMLL